LKGKKNVGGRGTEGRFLEKTERIILAGGKKGRFEEETL